MFLQASVILSTGGGGLPQCMLGYHHHHPPGADTPGSRHLPDQTPPLGRSWLWHTGNEQPVCILLECILVKAIFSQASVILFTGGGGGFDFPASITGHVTREVCIQGGLPPGGGSASRRGLCLQGVCLHGGLHPLEVGPDPPPRYMGYYGIRSTSRRYASYWNAFLFLLSFSLG